MKLNFWQWLGVILVVIGVVWWIASRGETDSAPTSAPPSTQAME